MTRIGFIYFFINYIIVNTVITDYFYTYFIFENYIKYPNKINNKYILLISYVF